jgi:L-amino acid N-acyltransferase YncA
LLIRQATEKDAPRIAEIYNHYVLNTTVTFEVAAIGLGEMEGRIREKLVKYNWLVGVEEGRIIGYSHYGSFRPRAAYNHTVESTIILDKDEKGRGYGSALYRELIESAAGRGFKEMIAVIALPNEESLKVHRKMGFKESGVLHNVGYKHDRYLDIGIWQKSLGQA